MKLKERDAERRVDHHSAPSSAPFGPNKVSIFCPRTLGQNIWAVLCEPFRTLNIRDTLALSAHDRERKFRIQLCLQIPDGRSEDTLHKYLKQKLVSSFSNAPLFQ